ncbi:Hsp33 family molecular chaperone HslO [Kordiimonas sp. SCSIO 12603]|uniref:Hsp33 family molecular chaperone HslO n=1 Tax=Kordiimonas sp. SCSIO 12603 TaxID=2829596 RepID=UPI0021076373|nr:Hsp33 family molecular chaperone HslO [Kordiimonas sp. SCSIO 12603]UTW58877.1 Hsp33 family molecular chaperone HslO [Kordiimonas sp. SCSIO 12603]
MTETPIVVKDPEGSRDNEVRPFQIEGMDVRGRAVRFGTVVDQILKAHDYPEPVARILGEMLVLTGMLGSIMKFDGIVTLQTKSAGPIPMMVADYERREDGIGRVRGYADIDQQKLSTFGKNPSFQGMIGSKGGYLALTIDQGDKMDRYQGIVELKGETLAEVARNYFQNSEQTPTEIRLNCDKDPVSGNWRAGGLMVQHLARGEVGQERILDRETQEHWDRASILMSSVKSEELLDPQLDLDQLLYRLYNEDGVRVFESSTMAHQCRCSRERLQTVLQGFSDEDIADMTKENGKIDVNCQFCNTTYYFLPEETRAS